MKNIAKRPWFFLSLLILALAVGGTINIDRAEATGVSCNDTVDGVTMLLSGNITCAGGGAVFVINGGHFDLNGFTMTCATTTGGCVIVGSGDRNHVNNGTIVGANQAVHLAGPGDRNKINDLVINGSGSSSVDHGVLVDSDSVNNSITGITVNTGRKFGVELENGSTGNKIHGNDLEGSTDGASDLNTNCDNNKWKGNTLTNGANKDCASG